jgi:tetratricopeptide (TPR) repeat protein
MKKNYLLLLFTINLVYSQINKTPAYLDLKNKGDLAYEKGDLGSASEYYEDIFNLVDEEFSVEDQIWNDTIQILWQIFIEKGDKAKAIYYLKIHIDEFRSKLPDEKYDLGIIHYNLAIVYYAQNDFENAEVNFDATIENMIDYAFDNDDPFFSMANEITTYYLETDKIEKGILILKKVISKSKYFAPRQFLLSSLYLSEVYLSQKNIDSARTYYLISRKKYRYDFAPNHNSDIYKRYEFLADELEVSISQQQYTNWKYGFDKATTEFNKGNFSKAKELSEQSLEIGKSIFNFDLNQELEDN